LRTTPQDPLQGLTVLERGWLSSNNLLIHAARGEPGAVLVDTSHVNHAAQTLALVHHALGGRPLARIVNTHLHSDHCGGNAALQREFGVPLAIPPGEAAAVRAWDESALSYRHTGQRIERFSIDDTLVPGGEWVAGGRAWEVIAAPGHDTHAVMLFDRRQGVLVSGDALWENGFGIVFPEVAGEPGFDDVAAVLDTIARLPVQVVVPGHGSPFGDAAAALERARKRLAGFRADPGRHAHHALKVMIKYHLMEEREEPEADVLRWTRTAPMLRELWARHPPPGMSEVGQWAAQAVQQLVAAGALRREGALLRDA